MDAPKSSRESSPCCKVPTIWTILTRHMSSEDMVKNSWKPTKMAVIGMFTAFVFPHDLGNSWQLYWRIPNGLYVEADPMLLDAYAKDTELEVSAWEY